MNSTQNGRPLGTCPKGFVGIIVGFGQGAGAAGAGRIDQLREMGFSEGLSVEIMHQSPFGGDPIAIRVGSMTVALRRFEANLVQVAHHE